MWKEIQGKIMLIQRKSHFNELNFYELNLCMGELLKWKKESIPYNFFFSLAQFSTFELILVI